MAWQEGNGLHRGEGDVSHSCSARQQGRSAKNSPEPGYPVSEKADWNGKYARGNTHGVSQPGWGGWRGMLPCRAVPSEARTLSPVRRGHSPRWERCPAGTPLAAAGAWFLPWRDQPQDAVGSKVAVTCLEG